MRSGSLLLSISESAALYSCLQYLLSGDLEIPILINTSPRFQILAKCLQLKSEKYRDWLRVPPDVYRRRRRRHRPPPISLTHQSPLTTRRWSLCRLTLTLGFERLMAANINLDLLRLGFDFFGEPDLQHALVIVGTHLRRIYRAGERERPREAAILPLNATEVLLFLFLLDLALAMDGQGVALDADINVLFVDARNFKLQSNGVLVLIDVHWRCEAGGCQRLFRAFRAAIRLMEKTVHMVHAVLHGGKLTERLPTGQ